ncbi:MAG TPA: PTS sugar transporter subunit IIA [Opitutales bacterium]|jgi:PTS system fructose-specific IIC component|nr:PTS sugar transporter subunit IIA [Opitutales bacterium]
MVVSVNLDLTATDAPAAIRVLADSLAHADSVADSAKLLADTLERESVLPTYVGDGVALPHARTDAVSSRVVAIARSASGVPFGPKGEKAHLIILVGCPRAEVCDYLAFSRQLLRRLREPLVRAELLAAPDAASFLHVLQLNEATVPAAAS